MAIQNLKIQGLRNLQFLDLSPSPDINLIYGANGSGKTSILESIFLLGFGRSFRARKNKQLIQDDQEQLTLFSRIGLGDSTIPLGMVRTVDGGRQIKLNGQPAKSSAELAQALPVLLIDPHTFELLEGSPGDRRRFLDWGVFHVEHSFYMNWKGYKKALIQRNKLLKLQVPQEQIQAWDRQLVSLANELDRQRRSYMELLIPEFESALSHLSDLKDIELDYFRGWDRTREIDEVLAGSMEKDLAQGYTHSGPHRAEIRIKKEGRLAVDYLSRGQQKLVVCAMKLAQGKVLENLSGKGCIYLLDDLAAELDHRHRNALCQLLESLKCQVFITSVERDSIQYNWLNNKEIKMFHVEHGRVSQE